MGLSSLSLSPLSAATQGSVYLLTHRSWTSRIGTGFRKCSFSRPLRLVTTRPASSSCRKCFITPKRVIEKRSSSALNVCPSSRKSSSSRLRRVGSASALNTSSIAGTIGDCLVTCQSRVAASLASPLVMLPIDRAVETIRRHGLALADAADGNFKQAWTAARGGPWPIWSGTFGGFTISGDRWWKDCSTTLTGSQTSNAPRTRTDCWPTTAPVWFDWPTFSAAPTRPPGSGPGRTRRMLRSSRGTRCRKRRFITGTPKRPPASDIQIEPDVAADSVDEFLEHSTPARFPDAEPLFGIGPSPRQRHGGGVGHPGGRGPQAIDRQRPRAL